MNSLLSRELALGSCFAGTLTAMLDADDESEQADVPVEDDPVEWFRRKGIHTYAKQREIVAAATREPRTVVTSANGTGKSFVVSALAAWHVARYRQRGKVVLIAPSARQLRTNLIPYISDFLADEPGVLPLKEVVRIGDWVALQSVALSSYKNMSTGLGAHAPHMLVILEEASGITQPMWRQIFTYTSGQGGHVLAIGNPIAGSLAEGWAVDPAWHAITVSAFDCPAFYDEEQRAADPVPQDVVESLTSREFVDTVKAEFGEESEEYNSSVLGVFTDSDNSLYFDPAALAACIANYDDVDDFYLEPPVLGFDVAGAGADSNKVWGAWPVRNPGNVRYVLRNVTTPKLAGCKDPKTAGALVANLALELGARRVRVDSLGPGAEAMAVIRDTLPDRIQVDGVNTGRPAGNRVRYLNKRAEIAATLRSRLRAGAYAIEPNAKLRQEFLAFRRVPPTGSREVLELKQNVKTRLGRSPDDYDAVALTVVADNAANVGKMAF